MWDFVKGLLGFPTGNTLTRQHGNFEDGLVEPVWELNDSASDNSFNESPFLGSSHFSVFTNPLEIHKYFEQQMDEMMKRVFSFGGNLHKPWQEAFDSNLSPPTGTLREEFLKPAIDQNHGKDTDLDGQIDSYDIERFMDNSNSSTTLRLQTPQFFSRSIAVQKIRRADGSIEITRTEKDHTGREITTVTQENPPGVPPLPRKSNDNPTLSEEDIFSKFFS